MLKVGAAFTILPGAGRIWVPAPCPPYKMYLDPMPHRHATQVRFVVEDVHTGFIHIVADLIDSSDEITEKTLRPYRQNAEMKFKRRQ